MSTESMMPSNHLILYHPFLFLPSIFPSIRVFSNGLTLHIRWPKYWSFSFSISPSNEYSGLIFFRTYWSDLLAVQGALKSFLQHHSLKASFLWCWAFFMIELAYPYMTTGKTLALTIWTFIGKMMSVFNTWSRFVIAFLPRSKRLLISWLQSSSTVILEPKKIKSVTVSIFFPIYITWSDGTRCHDLPFLKIFFCWVFSQLFHSPLSPLSRGSLLPLFFLPLGWCNWHIWCYWYFSQQSWFQFVIHPAQYFIYSVYKLNK